MLYLADASIAMALAKRCGRRVHQHVGQPWCIVNNHLAPCDPITVTTSELEHQVAQVNALLQGEDCAGALPKMIVLYQSGHALLESKSSGCHSEIYSYVAKCYSRLDRMEVAAVWWEAAVSANPQCPWVSYSAGTTNMHLARRYLANTGRGTDSIAKGMLSAARSQLLNSLASDSERNLWSPILKNLGVVLLGLNMYQEAAEAFHKLQEHNWGPALVTEDSAVGNITAEVISTWSKQRMECEDECTVATIDKFEHDIGQMTLLIDRKRIPQAPFNGYLENLKRARDDMTLLPLQNETGLPPRVRLDQTQVDRLAYFNRHIFAPKTPKALLTGTLGPHTLRNAQSVEKNYSQSPHM